MLAATPKSPSFTCTGIDVRSLTSSHAHECMPMPPRAQTRRQQLVHAVCPQVSAPLQAPCLHTACMARDALPCQVGHAAAKRTEPF